MSMTVFDAQVRNTNANSWTQRCSKRASGNLEPALSTLQSRVQRHVLPDLYRARSNLFGKRIGDAVLLEIPAEISDETRERECISRSVSPAQALCRDPGAEVFHMQLPFSGARPLLASGPVV